MSLLGELARELRREREEPVGVDTGRLLQPDWPQMAIRFVFGAVIALVAGLLGMAYGPRVGGLFLAFPAVLPAALTLLERKEGRTKTDVDAIGAVFGSLAMIAFAASTAALVGALGAPLAVAAAAGVWVLLALALFYGLRALLRRVL